MNKDKKMILGYIVGGLVVIGLVPSIIYIITWLFDNVYRLEIFQNPIIKWIFIIIFLVVGVIYGFWSIIIQNTIGKGGPVEIGNLEISPKTENLVVSGPYKNTRNPMLFGAFLIYLAFALYINSITAVVLVIVIFVFMLTVVVKMEEQRLLKDFGNQYEEYRKRFQSSFHGFKEKSKKNQFSY